MNNLLKLKTPVRMMTFEELMEYSNTMLANPDDYSIDYISELMDEFVRRLKNESRKAQ